MLTKVSNLCFELELEVERTSQLLFKAQISRPEMHPSTVTRQCQWMRKIFRDQAPPGYVGNDDMMRMRMHSRVDDRDVVV